MLKRKYCTFRGEKEFCLGLKHHFDDDKLNQFIVESNNQHRYMDYCIFSKDGYLYRVLLVDDCEDNNAVADCWEEDYFKQLMEVLTQYDIKTNCKDGILPKNDLPVTFEGMKDELRELQLKSFDLGTWLNSKGQLTYPEVSNDLHQISLILFTLWSYLNNLEWVK